jgi:tetratricopeptide (TPR) repeat protein
MRNTLTLIVTLIAITSFGQSAQEFLESGIEKENQQKHKEAIKDFTNAIKKDPNLAEAFFARGTVKMNISDLSGALDDFNEAIRIDPKQVSAIYNRAGIYANTQKFDKALLDLNSVISIDEKFPSALTLRGQIKSALNDNEGSCKDFQRAKEIGDKSANSYISKYCNEKDAKKEFLNLKWPKDENWKEQTPQENGKMKFVELLRNNETFDNWTEIGTMITYKGIVGEDVEFRAKSLYDQTKESCPAAKFTIIEMDKKIEYPWIIFSIECPVSGQTKTPESQIWYIIQGNSSLYANDRAIKQKSLPKDTIMKWTEFFKTGKVEIKK